MRYLMDMAAALFLTPASADDIRLWTVQAVDTGTEKVCDAFASGMHDRPPYEFRFRRAKDYLYLIVSYDGPKLAAETGKAEIVFDGAHMMAPASAFPFGGRNAFAVTINPRGFDFHQFDRTVPFVVTFADARFEIAFKADDHLGDNMVACMRAMKIE